MKKFKTLLLVALVVGMALFLSGCADITLEKWIKVDKSEDEVRGKFVTDYRQFYAMTKQEWEDSGIDYNAREENGRFILEIPRTKAKLVEEVNNESNSDLLQYTKEKVDNGTIIYTFGSKTPKDDSSSDSGSDDEWGKELGEAIMAGYKFKWIVHFPNKVLDVRLEGSDYEVSKEDYSGKTVDIEMPLKQMSGKIIVTTK